MGQYFTTRKVGDITIVKFLFSEISLEEAEEFKNGLYALAEGPGKRFAINMEKCVFIPSVVIGIIVQFAAKIHEKSGKIVFSCLSKEVRTIFKITKLEKIFEIYETEEDAIKSF